MKFTNFYDTAIISGKKVTGSTSPELKAASTKDKFVLNASALKLLGIKVGVDRVMFFDQQDSAISINDRFYVCKGGVDNKGIEHGALVGKGGGFSFSTVWSAIHMQDMNVSVASMEDMIAKGIVSPNAKQNPKSNQTQIIANQIVIGSLVIALGEDEDGETTEGRNQEVKPGLKSDIYSFGNMRVIPHTPKQITRKSNVGSADVDVPQGFDYTNTPQPVSSKGKK